MSSLFSTSRYMTESELEAFLDEVKDLHLSSDEIEGLRSERRRNSVELKRGDSSKAAGPAASTPQRVPTANATTIPSQNVNSAQHSSLSPNSISVGPPARSPRSPEQTSNVINATRVLGLSRRNSMGSFAATGNSSPRSSVSMNDWSVPSSKPFKVMILGDEESSGKIPLFQLFTLSCQLEVLHVSDPIRAASFDLSNRLKNPIPLDIRTIDFDLNALDQSRIAEPDRVPVELWLPICTDQYQGLRPMFFPATDVFVLFFDIRHPASFESVRRIWEPEAQQYRKIRDVPIVLVGCGADVRRTQSTVAVPLDEALKFAHEKTMAKYIEVFSDDILHIHEVLKQAVIAARTARQNRPSDNDRTVQEDFAKEQYILRKHLTVQPPNGNFDVFENTFFLDLPAGVSAVYTIDGSEPDALSTIYSGPINLRGDSKMVALGTNRPQEIRVRAFARGRYASRMVSFSVPPETEEPECHWDVLGQSFLIDTKPDTSYLYTTDGSKPTKHSQIYSTENPMVFSNVGKDASIRVIAVQAGKFASKSVSVRVLPFLDPPRVRFHPADRVFAVENYSAIYDYRYTLDGSEPTYDSLIYTAPVMIPSDLLVLSMLPNRAPATDADAATGNSTLTASQLSGAGANNGNNNSLPTSAVIRVAAFPRLAFRSRVVDISVPLNPPNTQPSSSSYGQSSASSSSLFFGGGGGGGGNCFGNGSFIARLGASSAQGSSSNLVSLTPRSPSSTLANGRRFPSPSQSQLSLVPNHSFAAGSTTGTGPTTTLSPTAGSPRSPRAMSPVRLNRLTMDRLMIAHNRVPHVDASVTIQGAGDGPAVNANPNSVAAVRVDVIGLSSPQSRSPSQGRSGSAMSGEMTVADMEAADRSRSRSLSPTSLREPRIPVRMQQGKRSTFTNEEMKRLITQKSLSRYYEDRLQKDFQKTLKTKKDNVEVVSGNAEGVKVQWTVDSVPVPEEEHSGLVPDLAEQIRPEWLASCTAEGTNVMFKFEFEINLTHVIISTPGGGKGPSSYELFAVQGFSDNPDDKDRPPVRIASGPLADVQTEQVVKLFTETNQVPCRYLKCSFTPQRSKTTFQILDMKLFGRLARRKTPVFSA